MSKGDLVPLSKGDLVPLPPTPPKSGFPRIGALVVLGLVLLLPVAYLIFTHASAPEPRVGAAMSEAEPMLEAQDSPAPASMPLPEAQATAEPVPLPVAKPVDTAGKDVPILPPPRPTPAALPSPSMPGPAPAQGWLLDQEQHASLQIGAGASRALVTHVNRDIDGSDYQVLRNQSQAGCESRCKADTRCRAYTFNTWEKVCFLKASAKVARIEPRGISGVLAMDQIRTSLRPPKIERLRSRQFPNRPYRSQKATDYDGCARACVADQSCLGFNFVKADRSCGLIATLDKAVPDDGTDAGMKWQAPVVASAATRRRAVPPRDLPPEAAIFFGMVRQMMRY